MSDDKRLAEIQSKGYPISGVDVGWLIEKVRELERHVNEERGIKEAEKKILLKEIERRVTAEARNEQLEKALRDVQATLERFCKAVVENDNQAGVDSVHTASSLVLSIRKMLAGAALSPETKPGIKEVTG